MDLDTDPVAAHEDLSKTALANFLVDDERANAPCTRTFRGRRQRI